jgi:hypothetical protein
MKKKKKKGMKRYRNKKAVTLTYQLSYLNKVTTVLGEVSNKPSFQLEGLRQKE